MRKNAKRDPEDLKSLNQFTQKTNPDTQKTNPDTQKTNPDTQKTNPDTQKTNPNTQQTIPSTQLTIPSAQTDKSRHQTQKNLKKIDNNMPFLYVLIDPGSCRACHRLTRVADLLQRLAKLFAFRSVKTDLLKQKYYFSLFVHNFSGLECRF